MARISRATNYHRYGVIGAVPGYYSSVLGIAIITTAADKCAIGSGLITIATDYSRVISIATGRITPPASNYGYVIRGVSITAADEEKNPEWIARTAVPKLIVLLPAAASAMVLHVTGGNGRSGKSLRP